MGSGMPSTITSFIRMDYPKRLDGDSKKGKNYVRNEIFTEATKSLVVDNSVIERYKEFLISRYVVAIQNQLPPKRGRRISSGYSRVKGTLFSVQNRTTRGGEGVASGNLKRTIQATAKVIIELDKPRGRFYINYHLTPNFEFYGEYIASGRRAGWIPIPVLLDWMEQKISAGFMSLRQSKSGREVSEEKLMVNVAYAIAKTAKKSAKPPVVSNWYNANTNKSLNDEFKKSIRYGGAYYRRLIRENIIKNIKTNNGNNK